ncbi:MAG: BON domain-containing protein [Acidobacteriota bacterium]
MKLSDITVVAILATVPAGSAFAQAAPTEHTKVSDQQLSSIIATKIANDSTLGADAIKVDVNAGVVTLNGMVAKDADKARAEQMARVAGVTRVDNKLKSREKATTATKDAADTVVDASKKGAKKTKEAVSKSGEVITDGWISSRIKTNFMGDEGLRASDIKVDTNNHVVTLSGAVANAAAHQKAISIAKAVEGVHRVVDKVTVVSTPK